MNRSFIFGSKKNHLFVFIAGAGSFLFFGVIIIAARIYPHLLITARSLYGGRVSTCDCASIASVMNNPSDALFLFGAGALLTFFFIFAITEAVILYWRTKKFVQKHSMEKQKALSPKLSNVAHSLGCADNIIWHYSGKTPFVFCGGLIRPRIFVSHALVSVLSREELEAVIKHEMKHQSSREPMQLFIVKFFTAIFFFVPGFARLEKYYLIYSELSADEYATDGFTKKRSLAGALSKILQLHEHLFIQRHLNLSFFTTMSSERIQALVDEEYRPRFHIFTRSLFLGFVLLLFGIFTIYTKAFAEDSSFNTTYAKQCNNKSPQYEDPVRCGLQEVWLCSSIKSVPGCKLE